MTRHGGNMQKIDKNIFRACSGLFVIPVMICLLAGCAGTGDSPLAGNGSASTDASAKAGLKKISAAEAKAKMEQGTPYILLDVRTEEEFKEGRIDGAVLIPDFEIIRRSADELPDKEALIFVYCRTGLRSNNAAFQLARLGYINVYDMGGIVDWPYGTISD